MALGCKENPGNRILFLFDGKDLGGAFRNSFVFLLYKLIDAQYYMAYNIRNNMI